ncbi:MAG TPA: hypothetical protein PKC28_14710, partial [Bdellovibrionales bacterium]|nr:hypothetical protein [Bdellovibrionales bacterium]
DLNPFARLVFLRDQALSDAEIRRAGGAINTVGARLADWFEREGDEYLFSDLSGLLSQIKSENGRFQDLIPALKRILIAGAPDRIAGDEWRLTAAALSRGYVAFLNLRHVTRGDLNSVLVRPELPSRIQELALILESGVERHPGGRIPGQEFKDLAAAITATGWLPKGAGPTAVHDVWVWLVRRPMSLGEGPDDGTLSLEILRNFTERLGGWRKLQQTDSADFARALKASAPMEWDSQGRIVFRAQGPATWLQRERMVWSFTFIDWIKESYVGSEPDELTTDQITRAAQEILPLLHGFGWMRSTTAKIGAKLLRESDLFTPSSNGDGRIQVHEGTRYLAYVASSFRAAELWLAQADGVCVKRDAECVRQVAANPATGVLDSLPRLKASLDGKGIEIFANYSKSAEETVLGRVVEGPYGTGDLLQTYMIFQYVENFLSRFDSDRSETVSLSESPPAFRLFGSTLEMLLSGVVPPEEMEAFFTFLLKYGNTPFTMFAGQVRWLNWKWHPDRWTFESDRTHLVGILNQLSKL